MKAAIRGTPQGAHISFASVDLMWEILNQRRWEIVRAMIGAGPLSIREVARRLHRDVKPVHGDVQALLKAGVIEKTDDGHVVAAGTPNAAHRTATLSEDCGPLRRR